MRNDCPRPSAQPLPRREPQFLAGTGRGREAESPLLMRRIWRESKPQSAGQLRLPLVNTLQSHLDQRAAERLSCLVSHTHIPAYKRCLFRERFSHEYHGPAHPKLLAHSSALTQMHRTEVEPEPLDVGGGRTERRR